MCLLGSLVCWCVCVFRTFFLSFLLPPSLASPPPQFWGMWGLCQWESGTDSLITTALPPSISPSLAPSLPLFLSSFFLQLRHLVRSLSPLSSTWRPCALPPPNCLLLLRLQALSWLEQRRGQTERIWVRIQKNTKRRRETLTCLLSVCVSVFVRCVWALFWLCSGGPVIEDRRRLDSEREAGENLTDSAKEERKRKGRWESDKLDCWFERWQTNLQRHRDYTSHHPTGWLGACHVSLFLSLSAYHFNINILMFCCKACFGTWCVFSPGRLRTHTHTCTCKHT